jgi:hypothetical protein
MQAISSLKKFFSFNSYLPDYAPVYISRRALAASSLVMLASCGGSTAPDGTAVTMDTGTKVAGLVVSIGAGLGIDLDLDGDSGAVPRAVCGPGSRPETGLQGQVPQADRLSGRSQEGYSCNLQRIGQYQGEGATWVNPFYRNCAYMGTSFYGIATKKSQGAQVVDLSDPTHPRFATNLTSPSFLAGTWESMKTNEKRGLLGGVAAGPIVGVGLFDVYDLNADCAQPQLQNTFDGLTVPVNAVGHEGNWAPDGLTYWSSGVAGGSLTAIDVTNPKQPRIVYTGTSVINNHGFSLSEDGNRMYLTTSFPAGLTILDVSDVQKRLPVPVIRQLGVLVWNPAGASQHSIPVTWGGKPYLIVTDELLAETVRIIDISDELKPIVVKEIRLEIHLPQNLLARTADTAGNGLFGYEAHYCTVDRKTNPTALACGFFQSGVRVFNVVDPLKPKEIAYYNPPAQVGKNAILQGSEHVAGVGRVNAMVDANLTADWCSSPPRFVGSDQLWVTCQDNGVQVLKFTNNVYKKLTNSNNPKLEWREMDD